MDPPAAIARARPLRARLPLAELLAFSRDPLGFLERLERAQGDVARFRTFERETWLLSHPDLVHRVLVAEARGFSKDRGLDMAKSLLGEGLLTSEGELHRRQRRLAQPAFHRDRVAAYAAVMTRRAEARAARWRDGEVLDVGREMAALALEIVAETLFGGAVGEDEIREIGEALDAAMASYTMARIPFHAVLDRLPLPSTLRVRRARAKLHGIVGRLVAARRARAADGGDDLLRQLLLAVDEEGTGGMSDGQLRDEAMTLFLAGHETTANLLTWTFHLLGRHPEEDARVAEEARGVLRGRPAEHADLARLPRALHAVSESMRLYPPAWTVARKALRPLEVRGHRIAAGSTVLLSQWVVHRHRAWWPEPLRFRPARWEEDPGARPRLAYFPFGAGPRICIGEGFAWTEAHIALSTISARWRLEPLAGGPVRPVARVTLRPSRPVLAVARARRAAA